MQPTLQVLRIYGYHLKKGPFIIVSGHDLKDLRQDAMTTASIDPENEHLIQEAMIAHRLATIENVDQILAVDEGQIVQKSTQGTDPVGRKIS